MRQLFALTALASPFAAGLVGFLLVSPPAPESAAEATLLVAGDVPEAQGFDLPVTDAADYYVAQGFGGESDHLGEDWNGKGGGDSDLGDPVLAVADGIVTQAYEAGAGWGQVVRVLHSVDGQLVESVYAHLDTVLVEHGQALARGEQLGTIGTAHGAYPAHLHLELRSDVGLPLGGGYGSTRGYLDPRAWIAAHPPRAEGAEGADTAMLRGPGSPGGPRPRGPRAPAR